MKWSIECCYQTATYSPAVTVGVKVLQLVVPLALSGFILREAPVDLEEPEITRVEDPQVLRWIHCE